MLDDIFFFHSFYFCFYDCITTTYWWQFLFSLVYGPWFSGFGGYAFGFWAIY